MGSDASSRPEWTARPPALFDIVTGYFPETKPKKCGPDLRPPLVTRTLRNKKTGEIACQVAYGTSKLRIGQRQFDDIIIQNLPDMDEMGLAVATRFILDPQQQVILPWSTEHFGCWSGHANPKVGALTIDYQKDYAFAMMRRMDD
jgi:hypothetical protein